MGKWIHKLSQVDREAKTAVCEHCGPTKIQIRGTGVARCGTKKKMERKPDITREYGITVDEWHSMLIRQSGRCDICINPMKQPHVDHCHATGVVRALLCKGCNLLLGNALDNPDILKAAISYLEEHRP